MNDVDSLIEEKRQLEDEIESKNAKIKMALERAQIAV